jgi:hypothetical protein
MAKKLHSIAGLFETPDEIIIASKNVADSAYKFWDTNTPYPIHGLDRAMKLKPSPMGYYALAFGLTGTALALILMIFTMAIDYPLNIGGKPDISLPAFIPVTFELTVLLAAIGTVVALLFVFFKFPDNSNPLHDTNYLKRCTSDRFGVHVLAEDEKFNEDEVFNYLKKLGAKDIEKIYFEEDEILPIFNKKFVGFLVLALILISGTTYFVTAKLMFMSPFNYMMDQHRVDVESPSDFFSDGFSMRNKVDGTVPKGFMPEDYKESPDSAGKYLINSLEYNEENIALGKKKYLTYCSPCHGNYAKGDSRLKDQFPMPPTLHSKKMNEWADGRIYHVITFGQGVMPSYAKQVTQKERWAIIQYIRTLQRALNPQEDDFNGAK